MTNKSTNKNKKKQKRKKQKKRKKKKETLEDKVPYVWMDGWGPCKKEEILYQLVHNVGKIRWEIRNASYCRPTLTTRYMYLQTVDFEYTNLLRCKREVIRMKGFDIGIQLERKGRPLVTSIVLICTYAPSKKNIKIEVALLVTNHHHSETYTRGEKG